MLDAVHLLKHLPSVVEAVFFPVRGPVHHPEGDERRAQAVRRSFQQQFGILLPLLSFDVSEARQGRAPFAPAPGEGAGSSSNIAGRFARMVSDQQGKFHRMWGVESWKLSAPGAAPCWGHEANNYFESLLRADHCDRNWLEGASGELGERQSRPTFPAGDAPSLLGFDAAIHDYCVELARGRPLDHANGDWNSQLAHVCTAANMNILRLLSGTSPWNM